MRFFHRTVSWEKEVLGLPQYDHRNLNLELIVSLFLDLLEVPLFHPE
jgi:hypothetical protein